MPRFALDQRGMTNRTVGPAGAAGSTGATGNGAVFQSVDALSGAPRSVTDWGPILNTAISGGTRHFVFGPFDYPYTTPISAVSLSALCFEGAAGEQWFCPPANAGFTRLIWNGTGSGAAIDISGTSGVNSAAYTFRDIAFSYTSASFTGTLIGAHDSTKHRFQRCHFGYAAQGQTITAALAFNFGDAIQPVFESCTFEGFLTYVQGFDGTTYHYCNTAKFHNCAFQGQCQHSIVNPGQGWMFDSCIFESAGAADQTVQSHISILRANSSGSGSSLNLTNCAHWDASLASTTWITQASGIEASIAFVDCIENNLSLTKSLNLQGNGIVRIDGGLWTSPIDVGDGTAAGSQKWGISLRGLNVATSILNLDSGIALANGYGHNNVDVSAIKNFSNAGYISRSMRTGLSREVADYVHAVPTYALNAGAPANLSILHSGNDMAGTVSIGNTGGGTSGTGLCVDVTFAEPPPLNPNFPPQPMVTVSAMTANAAACQPYALVNAGTPGKFTIGINVGIPAIATAIFAYRVVWS